LPSIRNMTHANASFTCLTQLTSFQSASPFASVNASIARANEALASMSHMPCFHEDSGRHQRNLLLNSFEIRHEPANQTPHPTPLVAAWLVAP
jgi:hypothetical protein